MATIKIINLSDLSVASQYEAEAPEQHKYGGPWASPELFAHLVVPENLDPRKVVPVEVPDTWIKEGEESVTVDPQDDTWTLVPAHIEIQEDTELANQIDAQDQDLAIRSALRAAMSEGNQIVEDFTAENIVLGITADNMTGAVLDAMAPVMEALRSGSLYEAITRAKAVPAESKDDKYVTDSRLLAAVNRIETYLDIPLSETL